MSKHNNNQFTCSRGELTRSACEGEGFFGEHEGSRYCVLHFPGRGKSKDFNAAIKKKFIAKDFNFRGVWFPDEIDFEGTKFDTSANFHGAIFNQNVYFGQVMFLQDVDFSKAVFSAGVFFYRTTFASNVKFYKATFNGEAYFGEVTMDANANFRSAVFRGSVRFIGSVEKKGFGELASFNLQFAHFEKAEHVTFHTLYLRPHWFINTDPRKFEFIDIAWPQRQELKGELKSLEGSTPSPHRLMAITYRQLAVNAEENHRYHEASHFRYNAFQVSRIERFRGIVPWRLEWWYWLVSGYGEKVGRAIFVFVAMLAFFAIAYTRVGFEGVNKTTPTTVTDTQVTAEQTLPAINDTVGEPLRLMDAITYAGFVSVLQKPDPKPLTPAAKFLVLLETLLGPIQVAMIALAVRRRFMR